MPLTRCISTHCRLTAYSHLLDPIPTVHGFISFTRSQQSARGYYSPRQRIKPSEEKASTAFRNTPKSTFIGRERELKKIWDSLRPQEPPKRRVAVLHGPDGLGKTRLAAQFAQLHSEQFTSVWWVDGSSKNTMLASLAQLASRLPTSEVLSYLSQPMSGGGILKRQSSMVSDYLRSSTDTRWLLVVDGLAGDMAKLDDFVPGGDHGSVLVTSTSPQPQVLEGEFHTVKPLSPQESLALLTHLTSDGAGEVPSSEIEEQAKMMLTRHLEGLPFAFILAAAYVQQTGLSTSSYLSLYLAARRAAPATEECPLTTACKLSYQGVKLLSPLAANVLFFLSCYNHTNIASSVLDHAQHMPRIDALLQSSKHEMRQAIKTLQDFLLITVYSEGKSEFYNIHPMIQSWCRSIMSTNEQKPQNIQATALHSLGKMAAAATNPQEPDRDAKEQSLLPHADEMRGLLQHASAIPSSIKTLEAIMNIGSLYQSQGLLSEAEGMYLHALVHADNMYSRWHPTTRRILRTLRRIRFQRGRMGYLIAQYWWVSVLLRTWELLAGSVLIILSIGTWLILALIIFFAWLVTRLAWMDGQTDSDKGVDLHGEKRGEERRSV